MNKEVRYLPITDLLTEIIDNRGKSVPTVDSGFPLIATNCIKHSSIYPVFDKVRYVSEHTLKTWFRAHIKPNDILFVNKGTPGRVCLVPNPVTFCVAQDMMAFRSDPEKINYKYLFAVLRSNEIQKKIENNHVGLVIPHFRKQELSSLLIPIKSKQEQKAIGDLYISLSEKIELNNKINQELEAMAKTLYDYWFVQFDFPTPPSSTSGIVGKPYKSSGGKMVYNEELKREIPEGWEVKALKNILYTINDSIEPHQFSDLKYLPIDKLPSKQLYYQDYSERANANSSLIKFNEDDILLGAMRVYFHRVCNAIEDGISRSTIMVLRAINPSHKNYGLFTLSTNEAIDYANKNSTGTSIPYAKWDNGLSNFKVVLPREKLIEEFNKQIEPILNQFKILSRQNQQLSSLRDWLLPMLMNGQVASRASATAE